MLRAQNIIAWLMTRSAQKKQVSLTGTWGCKTCPPLWRVSRRVVSAQGQELCLCEVGGEDRCPSLFHLGKMGASKVVAQNLNKSKMGCISMSLTHHYIVIINQMLISMGSRIQSLTAKDFVLQILKKRSLPYNFRTSVNWGTMHKIARFPRRTIF